MKYILSVILSIVFFLSSIGQNVEVKKVDSLIRIAQLKQNRLNLEIEALHHQIDSLIDVKNSLIERQYYGESFICIQSTYIFPTAKPDYKAGYLLKKDEKVKVVERTGDYYKVLHKGSIGYVLPAALILENQIMSNIIEEQKTELKKLKNSVEQDSIENESAKDQSKIVIERLLNEYTHSITRIVTTINGIQNTGQFDDSYIIIKQFDHGKYVVGIKDNSDLNFIFVTVRFKQEEDGIYIYSVIENDMDFENLKYVGASEKLSNMAKGVKGDVILFYSIENNLFISTK
jgi:hypothetical protein